jgi:hypothetical protein
MYLRVVKIKVSADILLERSFNLTAVVLCLFGCRAIPTFWRPKSCKKPRHTEKSVSPRFAQELLCQAISFGRASFVT